MLPFYRKTYTQRYSQKYISHKYVTKSSYNGKGALRPIKTPLEFATSFKKV